MRAVTKKLAHKLREAQARRRNSRFPCRALGQRFLHDLVALTSRVAWDSVDMPIYSCWNRVMEQLWPYYGTDTYEGRLLIDLAIFAPVCQILVAAIDTAVKIVSADEDTQEELLTTWLQQLQAERDRQMAFFEELLQDPTRLWVEIGGEVQQLKILTRVKHSVETSGGVLTARELDVTAAVYDAVVRLSGLVVVEIPEWFSTSEMEWEHAQVSRLKGGGEEQCLRAVSIWGELNHPNVRTFFGACHVGNPLIIHEKTLPIACRSFSWDHMLDVACGLAYLHGRGLVHTTLSAFNILWSARQHLDGKAVLSGINLVRIEDSSKHELVKTCAQLISDAGPVAFPTVLAQELFRSYVEAVPAFNLLIFSGIGCGVVTYWRDQVRKRSARQGRCTPPCVSSDIQAFGFAIAEMMRTRADIPFRARRQLSRYMRSRKLGIPPKRLAEQEWNLIVGMCAEDPAERLPLLHVVESISGLSTVPGSSEANAVFTNIGVYTFNGQSISDMLQDAGALCEQLEEARCVHQPVLGRLVDMYKQLQNTVVKQLEVEDFVLILAGFIRLIDHEDGYSSQSASEGESRTIAGKNYSIHHHIDRFMARVSLNSTAAVHRWCPEAQAPMRELGAS